MTKSKPVCKICNDTHMMWHHELEREVMCTHCPTPCQKCRAGGKGAYCENTPCDCDCHKTISNYATPIKRLIDDTTNKSIYANECSSDELNLDKIIENIEEAQRICKRYKNKCKQLGVPPYSDTVYTHDVKWLANKLGLDLMPTNPPRLNSFAGLEVVELEVVESDLLSEGFIGIGKDSKMKLFRLKE